MQEETGTYVLRLYRKECNAPTKKPTKATLAKADNELALSRVRRSDLESFLRSGAFHKLTPLPAPAAPPPRPPLLRLPSALGVRAFLAALPPVPPSLPRACRPGKAPPQEHPAAARDKSRAE